MSKEHITYSYFEKVEIRTGTIIEAQAFPEARKPAIKLRIDFGEMIGILKSSAQITDYYDPSVLIGKQIVAVVNFPPRQIGPFMSECLVLGALEADGKVVLLGMDKLVANGLRIA